VKRIVFFITILLPLVIGVSAEELTENPGNSKAHKRVSERAAIIQPKEEAPKVLYKTDITGADVDFYMQGSWETSLSLGTGILLQSGYPLRPLDYFPGSDTGFLYENIPDLTFSVYLMKKYFLELSVLSDFDKNSFLIGYKNDNADFLKYFYLGNRDIKSKPYPFIEVPDAGNSSLGAEAEFYSGYSAHDPAGEAAGKTAEQNTDNAAGVSPGNSAVHHVMIRYDSNGGGVKYFLGSNEVTEETVQIRGYIRGKYFFIPDTDVNDFILYLSDSSGTYTGSDGLKYREALPSDFSFNGKEGTLSLKEDYQGKIAVFYTKNGQPVGDSSIGKGGLPGVTDGKLTPKADPLDFSWNVTYLGEAMSSRKVSIVSRDCLVLWDRGNYSPFEICNTYKVSASLPESRENIRVRLVNRDNKLNGAGISGSIMFRTERKSNTVTATPIRPVLSSERNFLDYFPFPDPNSDIYGPIVTVSSDSPEYEILVQILQPVEAYVLEDNIIPGSVYVLKNGIEENRFEVDYNSGKITFNTEILPDDFLEIRYSRMGISERGGDLIFDWGNRIRLSKNVLLELATGFRWNILSGSYTEEEYEHTGGIVASAGVSAVGKNYNVSTSVGAGYSMPDTTGTLRIAGMEDSGTNVEINEDNIYPSSVPADIPGLTRENRGKLFYKDYRNYGAFGSVTLRYYEDPVPEDQSYPYESGSMPGPYIVGGSSFGKNGKSMVLDFRMDSGKNWVGAEIPMGKTGGIDLSSAESVSVSFKVLKISGNVRLYLEAGETGEDIDGDSFLDIEEMESSHGFAFNDTGNGAVLYVGGGPRGEGNGRIDSEDIDGNGFLDSDNTAHIVSVTTSSGGSSGDDSLLFSGGTGTEWQKFTYNFTESEREKLRYVRSVRLVAVKDSGDTAEGTILIDRITFNGSTFWQNEDSPGKMDVSEIDESFGMYPPGTGMRLEELFPEVKDTFHPHGEEQKVLELSWDSLPAGGGWTSGRYLNKSLGNADYRKLVFYLRAASVENTAGSEISISLTDTKDRGISISFAGSVLSPGAASLWKKVEIDLGSKTVSINGEKVEPPATLVTVDPVHDSYAKLVLDCKGSVYGTLYADEFSFKEPAGSVGAAFKIDANYRIPGNIFSIGSFNIFSDFTLHEQAYTATPGFSPLYGIPENYYRLYSFSEASFSINALAVYLSVLYDGRSSSDLKELSYSLAGGHSLTLPVRFLHTTFKDSFSKKEEGQGESMSKGDSILVNLPQVTRITAGIDDSLYAGLFTQSWYGNINIDILSPLILSCGASVKKSFTDYTEIAGNYFSSWIKSFSYFVPYFSEAETDRLFSLNAGITLDTKPAGIKIGAETSTENSDVLRDRLYLSVEVPLKFFPEGGNALSVTPEYTRELKLTSGENRNAVLIEDIEKLKKDIFLNSYIGTGIPFKEMVGENLKDTFSLLTQNYEQASYTPGFLINLSRNYGSRIIDLIAPSMLAVSFKRELNRDFNEIDDAYTAGLKLRSSALNLFGKLGAYPFFNFYSSDEFGNSLFLDMNFNGDYSVSKYSLSAEQYLTLFWGDNDTLTLRHLLKLANETEIQYSDSTGFSFIWNIKSGKGLDIPYVPEKVMKGSFIKNTETLSGSTENSHPVNVTVGHESSIILPDYGYVKLNSKVGFDYESMGSGTSGQKAFRILFGAGLEVKVKF